MNLTDQLAKRIRGEVWRAQRGKAARLVGKTVRRNGVDYHVVKLQGDRIVVSDLKTPLDQTTTFSQRAFLSKAVTVLEPKKAEG